MIKLDGNGMDRIKVSIIVAIYNVEKYLVRCLESLVEQSLSDIEIILVDDGSTDGSSQICDEYAKNDSRIIVIHKENQGLGMARNTGLDLAKGEYVVFVDSDDFVSKNAYQEMYDKIKNDDADMLITNFFEYNTNTQTKRKAKVISTPQIIKSSDVKKLACQMVGASPMEKELDDIGMSVWKNMYSRDVIEKNNIRFCSEREFVSEDAIFHLMLVPKMKKISMMVNAYYYYCQNEGGSLSSTFRKSKFEEYKKLLKKELELLDREHIMDEGKYFVTTTFLGNVRAHVKQLVLCDCTLKEKRTVVKAIVNDNFVQNILGWYPYKMTSIKQKIFSIMLKWKWVDMVLILGKLQGLR